MASGSARVPADSLGRLSELGSGGQGTVYEFSGGSAALAGLPFLDLVYKEYNRSARTELNPDVLEEMARYGAELTPGLEGLGQRVAWPLAAVERGGEVSGFLMRQAPVQYVVQLRLPSGHKAALAEAQHLLNGEQFLVDRQLPVHDRWRLQFLRDTADTLAQLHRSDILVGDLSPKNLLASFTSRPYCFFLDCDTMRMAARSALPQVETTGWEVPEGEEPATTVSDSYKLALLAIRLFAGDQDSKDATALAGVHAPLGELARRGISADPAVRPAPGDWLPVLDAATPHATTTLPWQKNGLSGNSGMPRATPQSPWGEQGSSSAPPSAPRPGSALNHPAKVVGLVVACLVTLLIVVSAMIQEVDTATAQNPDTASTVPIPGGTSTIPGTTASTSLPSDPATALEDLNQQVAVDNAEIRSTVEEKWVPQLASAHQGTEVDGVIFDYPDILNEHQALRQKYPQARLVWSGDWPVFKGRDFFVTILAIPFDTAEEANGWCEQQGVDQDHCFAKMLSQMRGPEGSTKQR